MARVLLLLVVNLVISANGFLNRFSNGRIRDALVADDPGSPLFLTPYIESGNIEEARNLSRVHFPGFPDVKSYAGFITVDKTYNSSQFFWYFPAKTDTKDQTVIVWLQGGPGASSLFGLFDENGPFEVNNGTFRERKTHWALKHNLIYIDNPVGTGFSFTNDSRGYCTNQTQIGEHLYTTLVQFFQLFPELQKWDFFVSGESYAGKYVPALGYTIHKKNPSAKLKINLKGLMIGNGLCDPINQMGYADYLYQIGLVDWHAKKDLELLQNQTIDLIKKQKWHDAFESFYKIVHTMELKIRLVSLSNYLQLNTSDELDYGKLIQSVPMRRAIHVGNLTYNKQDQVFKALSDDMMKSVAPWISELLEHYYMLFYNGQVDIGSAYPLTVNFLKNLNFSSSDEYLKAKRNIVFYDEEDGVSVQIGYMKSAGRLTEALIRDAGHMVPADQPEWILHVINTWRFSIG